MPPNPPCSVKCLPYMSVSSVVNSSGFTSDYSYDDDFPPLPPPVPPVCCVRPVTRSVSCRSHFVGNVCKSVVKNVSKPVCDSVCKPVCKPVVRSVCKPVVKSVSKPVCSTSNHTPPLRKLNKVKHPKYEKCDYAVNRLVIVLYLLL